MSILETAKAIKKSNEETSHFCENLVRRMNEIRVCAEKCIEGLKSQNHNLQNMNTKIVKMNTALAQTTAKLTRINEAILLGNKRAEMFLNNLKEQTETEKSSLPVQEEVNLADEMLNISLENLPDDKLVKAN